MVEVMVLRVFTDVAGAYGNHLGLVLDGGQVAEADRTTLAAKLGFSATVYVDDLATGELRIHTPGGELPFAGHPVVGTAWAIARETGALPATVLPPAGPVPVRQQDGSIWITASLAGTPPWWHERLATAAQVGDLAGPLDPGQDMTQLWAWEDETTGHVRARVFAGRLGITEDEACGSASMRLSAALGRPLTVRHGAGSVIHVRPGVRPGTADVGGRVVRDEVRHL
ncbi:PhzF family phenazine biosynthesis protein [Acrocarpospora catenulata]|uniref:PhzF family phenazine biosynthesis protein n=1 Tax=Acrocarpospora catenulata TaxID=2836182 RepID=UPI001BDA11F8|nr:PhzF family phenazine biosynthesis protein [Acrocarpospora catenulata]